MSSDFTLFLSNHAGYLEHSNEEVLRAIYAMPEIFRDFLVRDFDCVGLPENLMCGDWVKKAQALFEISEECEYISIEQLLKVTLNNVSTNVRPIYNNYCEGIFATLYTSQKIRRNAFSLWRAIGLVTLILKYLDKSISAFAKYVRQVYRTNINFDRLSIHSVGDLHEQGRSALRVECDGNAFFLKEGNLASYDLISDIIRIGQVKSISLPKTVFVDGFSIEEKVNNEDFLSKSVWKNSIIDMESLSYAINLTDLHKDNVFQQRNGICIIDYETAFRPVVARSSGHVFQNVSYVGNLFSPRYFKLGGKEDAIQSLVPSDMNFGFSKLKHSTCLSDEDVDKILDASERLMRVVSSCTAESTAEYRVLLMDTEEYENNIPYFFDELGDNSLLGSLLRWISLYCAFETQLQFTNLNQGFRQHATFMLNQNMMGFIPTTYHSLNKREIYMKDGEKNQTISFARQSAANALSTRRKFFKKNRPFNKLLLKELYGS